MAGLSQTRNGPGFQPDLLAWHFTVLARFLLLARFSSPTSVVSFHSVILSRRGIDGSGGGIVSLQ